MTTHKTQKKIRAGCISHLLKHICSHIHSYHPETEHICIELIMCVGLKSFLLSQYCALPVIISLTLNSKRSPSKHNTISQIAQFHRQMPLVHVIALCAIANDQHLIRWCKFWCPSCVGFARPIGDTEHGLFRLATCMS